MVLQRLAKSLLRPLPVTLAAALLGAIGGYSLGRNLAQNRARHDLEQDSIRVFATVNASMTEMRRILATLNASPYPRCSHAEMQFARGLVFHSEFVRDAGHMEGGSIVCSAALGSEGLPGANFRPDIVESDGTRIYRDLQPFRNPAGMSFTFQAGNSFVVRDPRVEDHLRGINLHFNFTVFDETSASWVRLSGQPPLFPASVTNHDGEGRLGDNLWVTHCSSAFPGCITSYASIAQAASDMRPLVLGCSLLGAFVVAFLSLLGSALLVRRRSMVDQLRRAIARNELFLAYQPIVDLPSRRIVGAEALVRWNHRGRPVSPGVFVAVAEQHGFVAGLTRWVVRRALTEFGPTLRATPGFRLSLNVAAADLADPRFLPMLHEALTEAKVQPASLTLEITESTTARGTPAEATIPRLRDAGYSVHIDDFGTGYSSLSYLQDLAVDGIKIDRAFTHSVGTGAANSAVLPRILAMAEALNLEVVVEGIENDSQADYFFRTGQPLLAQGWLFGRPSPAADLLDRLARQPRVEQFHASLSV